MRISLELEPKDVGPFEYDVYGGYLDQEDADHWATFDNWEAAEKYKAELEENNPNLQLAISRRKVS